MKSILTLLASFLIIGVTWTQTTKIKGTVQDSLSGSIPGVSVMLIGAQDSILKSFAVTNSEGIFTLTGIKSGDYLLKATFYGYIPYEQKLVVDAEDQIEMGVITLQNKTLNTVTVQGEYIPIQIKGDTIEYDSRAFVVQEQDMVEDLLEQMPGIEIGEDGSIKAQGKDVQKVLVNGEEFFGDDPTIATKNVPANSVSKIQVYDKTSDKSEFTGVDDGEETTTINIELKDDRKRGMFGNFDLAGGMDIPYQNLTRYKAKGNVHYFVDKWQFSVIGMSNNINETGFSMRDYMNFMGGAQNMARGGFVDFGGPMPISNGTDDGFLNSNSTGINLNFKPSDKTTLSSSIFLSVFDKNYLKELDRLTYYADSTIATNEIVDQQSNNLSNRMNLKFEQKFDSTQYLILYFDGSWNRAEYYSGSYVLNYNAANDSANDFNTSINQNNFNYDFSSRLDYSKKFNKSGRFLEFNAGYSASNNDFDNRLSYVNTIFQSTGNIELAVLQNQYNLEATSNMNFGALYSEPIGKRQLLQFGANYDRSTESRNREVYDISASDELINAGLTGQGDYENYRIGGTLTHKYIGKKIKTTFDAEFVNLTLTGANIFTSNKNYQYLLPRFQLNWEIGKKADMRLNYRTSLTVPTLNQLQPLPNNTTPSEIILGNIKLIPEYNHTVSLRYHSFNEYNFTFFFASLNGTYTQNNITYSQSINEFYVRELTPENIGDEKSASAFLTLGTSLYPIKTKFKISNSSNVSNGLVNLNAVQDQYTSYSSSVRLTLDNIGKKVFNLRGGVGYSYSLNTYLNNSSFNNSFNTYDYFASIGYNIKDRWELETDFTHSFFPNFTTNSEIMIWNARVGLNLLKSRKLQVYVSGMDLLNQNTGISQYYLQNIYEQETTQTLARYVMVGMKYSFQKLNGGSK